MDYAELEDVANAVTVDLRFSIFESVYMEGDKIYNICGHPTRVKESGMYEIVIAGKLLGSGVVQAEQIIYEREGDAQ